jgi:hypothetical protein
MNKITQSAGSLSSSQPGGPPCWTSPLAFGLIGSEEEAQMDDGGGGGGGRQVGERYARLGR